jgi:hypothetical protein
MNNMTVIVYGASDDLIEIEGDLREEFNWIAKDGETRLLAFSDGTLLRVWYDQDGIWRLSRVASGSARFEKVEGDVEKDTPDKVKLSGVEIKWVVFGEQMAMEEIDPIEETQIAIDNGLLDDIFGDE